MDKSSKMRSTGEKDITRINIFTYDLTENIIHLIKRFPFAREKTKYLYQMPPIFSQDMYILTSEQYILFYISRYEMLGPL
jgi:hypothetical protein